jgi:hypothetical protein
MKLKSLHTLQIMIHAIIIYASSYPQFGFTKLITYHSKTIDGLFCTRCSMRFSTVRGRPASCSWLRGAASPATHNLWYVSLTTFLFRIQRSRIYYDVRQLLPCCYRHRIHSSIFTGSEQLIHLFF